MKQRMLQSRTALQEADNWTTLSENVEEVFATGDVQKVSQLCGWLSWQLSGISQIEKFKLKILHSRCKYGLKYNFVFIVIQIRLAWASNLISLLMCIV